MNTKAFNEQVVMVSRGLLRNEVNGIVMIHTEIDGNVVSSYSVDIENQGDIFRMIGALESMKKTLLDKFVETPDDED